MADVARLAGVSLQTVSRVINDHPSVSPETRARVERAIAQLGYRRNTAARALVTRQSRTFGVVSVDTSHYGPARTLFGIEEAARAAGYFVNFVSVRHIDRFHMRAAVHHLMGAGVDGLAVIAPLATAVEAVHGLVSDVPLVSVASGRRAADMSVSVDQETGARLATRHLLDLGHATVHHVSGPDDWLDAEARERGWRAELAAAGVAAPELIQGDWSAASGLAAGRTLAGRSEATAIFASNDEMALGVLLAMHEAGRRVPEDVSIVGFDDIPESGFFLPPLTTVRQDFTALGRACIDRLTALVRGDDIGSTEPVAASLVVRSSSGAGVRTR